jgi:uncharacterized protein YeaO (DUF488 family)
MKFQEELFSSAWYKGLMENKEFRKAFENNHSIRYRMAKASYLQELLTSELARMDFVEKVLNGEHEKRR